MLSGGFKAGKVHQAFGAVKAAEAVNARRFSKEIVKTLVSAPSTRRTFVTETVQKFPIFRGDTENTMWMAAAAVVTFPHSDSLIGKQLYHRSRMFVQRLDHHQHLVSDAFMLAFERSLTSVIILAACLFGFHRYPIRYLVLSLKDYGAVSRLSRFGLVRTQYSGLAGIRIRLGAEVQIC